MTLATFAGALLGGVDAAAFGGLEGEVGSSAVGEYNCDPVVVGHLLQLRYLHGPLSKPTTLQGILFKLALTQF